MGAGVTPKDVKEMLTVFENMKKMSKMLKRQMRMAIFLETRQPLCKLVEYPYGRYITKSVYPAAAGQADFHYAYRP